MSEVATKEIEEEDAEKELTNIRPTRVSIVDLGANGETFFVAKAADGDGDAKSAALITVTQFLQATQERVKSLSTWFSKAEIDDEQTDTPEVMKNSLVTMRNGLVSVKNALEGKETLSEVAKVAGSVRDKSVTILDALDGKLATTIKSLESSEDGTVPSDFIEKLDTLISDFEEIMTEKSEDESEEVEAAVWSTAFINDLPDSAFLYIVPGGKKDEDGKTVPRTNRKFPYKNQEGNVDLPHLRNAIARIPQSNLSQDLKDSLQAKARRILAEHTEKSVEEEETMSEKSFVEEIMKNADKDVELVDEEVTKQVSSAKSKLDEILSALAISPEDAERMDYWDIRCAIGDAVQLLMNAAKLDMILGSEASTEMSADDNVEKKEKEMSTEEETTKTASTDEEKETEKAVEETPRKEDVSEEGNETPDLASTIAAAVATAIKPLTEKIEGVTEQVQKNAEQLKENSEKVEKMERARADAKGGDVEETTAEKSSDKKESPSVFTSMMPEHLTGEFKHGERVKE